MATYLELHQLNSDSDLQDKVRVASVIAADTIRSDGAPPANQAARLAWAANVLRNPVSEAERMLWAVLAANKSSSVAEIQGASDANIQTAVDSAVDLFADNALTSHLLHLFIIIIETSVFV